MDLASLIGIAGAVGMVAFGIVAGGGSIIDYIDIASVIITLFGSLLATMGAHPLDRITGMMKVVTIVFSRPKLDPTQTILTLLSFSEKARREGILALEESLEEVNDPFLRKGVQLVVDGTEPEMVKAIMTAELDALDTRHAAGRKLVEDWAEFAPAFGMIGTLIGLIVMMKALGGDPSAIGRGMAAALLTTLYGAILANAVLIPMGKKLEVANTEEVLMKEITIEGTLSIQAGDNPRMLQEKLTSYFPPALRNKIKESIGE